MSKVSKLGDRNVLIIIGDIHVIERFNPFSSTGRSYDVQKKEKVWYGVFDTPDEAINLAHEKNRNP